MGLCQSDDSSSDIIPVFVCAGAGQRPNDNDDTNNIDESSSDETSMLANSHAFQIIDPVVITPYPQCPDDNDPMSIDSRECLWDSLLVRDTRFEIFTWLDLLSLRFVGCVNKEGQALAREVVKILRTTDNTAEIYIYFLILSHGRH